MDFYRIAVKEPKKGEEAYEIYPDFIVGRSKDLMVRGKSFYAVWDEKAGIWSTDEYDVQRLVDEQLWAAANEMQAEGKVCTVKSMRSFNSNSWVQFKRFMTNVGDNSHQLDENLTFANTEVKKRDYVSRRLPYALEAGSYAAWDELVGTLYNTEERAKIEWAIGAIVSGDAKKIQKFLVLYGPAGTGKSTILNIVQKLFEGYTTTFEAKALGSSNGSFATEVFKNNPLVAIQHDGDLSRIEDNTRLNSIISHEEMTMNEKYKASYTAKVNAFLLMGTNQPVKISDSKSGIIRRLIDVHPTGVKIPANHYNALMSQIDFELGTIAHHCLGVYQGMGKNYYNAYRPLEMMLQTDVFFNFVESCFDIFKSQDGATLKQAYSLYKEFCSETGVDKVLPQYKVREELRNYFEDFHEKIQIDGHTVRSYYKGFSGGKFKTPAPEPNTYSLVIEETTSLLDEYLADQPAQGAKEDGTPIQRWAGVQTKLKDLDTSQLHFVKVPTQHIVIDFDLTDENGEKSLEANLQAASVWPPTYAELSKSGNGVHLHYTYVGDVTALATSYSEGIEVKTLLGDSSLRRRFRRGNNIPVADLTNSLPLKEKRVLSEQTIKSEKGLRDLIIRNLRKEIHPGTKSSVDFIKKILDDAYESGMDYDVSDMKSAILTFARSSTNQALQAIKVAQNMKFQGQNESMVSAGFKAKDDRLVIFDVEVYPNLFVVCWKFKGDGNVVRMINPSSVECEELLTLKLVGFNNRKYDNHILYARAVMGYNNLSLYNLSQAIISGNRSAMFGAAYDLSFCDIYEFSSKKQTLKRFQFDLGLRHKEMSLPWDQPVPEELWADVCDYCVNDVITTEAVLDDREQDYVARQILAELSGLTMNDTTQKHTAKIIFGDDRSPQDQFVYTDLRKEFPGYEHNPYAPAGTPKSSYRGEDPSEGGYVYAEPGMYENVAVLDVASMHPTSLVQLNAFGPYTPNFEALMAARLAIKSGDYDSAKVMLGGKLAPYLGNQDKAEALSYALKIVINIVYGMTSAKFDNPFKDPRNIDNIVAKRGALFMIDLKNACQERGLQVVHIKTDSIKIPGATQEDIEFVTRFGEKYGYTFEHEATYDRFCLVNEAVYIARYGWAAKEKKIGTWDAVGAQFQHPYVYKTLFSKEDIQFSDLCEIKQVQKGTMWIDYDYDTPLPTTDRMQFVGRSGQFVPVLAGHDGGVLYRVFEDKCYSVSGTKGYLWMEAEAARHAEIAQGDIRIDNEYYDNLLSGAMETIGKYGDVESFIN